MAGAASPSPRRARGTLHASAVDRLAWAVLWLLAVATLALARLLVPASAGIGTHQQLGLPPCGLYEWLRLPCPACGLTTSFAHLARLQVEASLHANPMGLPLFVATAFAVPLTALAFIRRRSVAHVIDAVRADRIALWFVIALLASWVARLVARSV